MTTTQKVIDALRCADLSRTRAYTVSSDLCMCLSSMNQKLVLEGSKYSELLEEERKRRASEILKTNPRADGEAIASACGFTNRNYAYIAVKSWFGLSLSDIQGGLRHEHSR